MAGEDLMATGNIITPVGSNGYPLPAYQLGASQNVAYNAAGGASTQSTVVGASTTLILVAATLGTGNGVRIAVGANPTASSTTTLLPASGVYAISVQPGWVIAVLSNDTNTGSINITEAANWG